MTNPQPEGGGQPQEKSPQAPEKKPGPKEVTLAEVKEALEEIKEEVKLDLKGPVDAKELEVNNPKVNLKPARDFFNIGEDESPVLTLIGDDIDGIKETKEIVHQSLTKILTTVAGKTIQGVDDVLSRLGHSGSSNLPTNLPDPRSSEIFEFISTVRESLSVISNGDVALDDPFLEIGEMPANDFDLDDPWQRFSDSEFGEGATIVLKKKDFGVSCNWSLGFSLS
ncbi:hypothetical protein KJ693_05685 [bacterium]|nr:hypothetical protein [bacterium]MBU1614790.1 hypothetical protein [bacterium]